MPLSLSFFLSFLSLSLCWLAKAFGLWKAKLLANCEHVRKALDNVPF